MGYDKKLPADKVRLVENPKKFMEEYIESVLAKKAKDNEIVSKDEQTEEKEINPIVLKQLKSLKNTMNSHKLSINDIMKHLKDNE
jgi:phosphoribosyl-ATP pyrophosphohydrolase